MPEKAVKGHRHTTRLLRAMLPAVPLADFRAIEAIAAKGHLRHLPPSIRVWQAVTTHIRHVHTDYDELLAEGYDPAAARHFVIDAMNAKLSEWGALQRLSATADDPETTPDR